MLEVLTEPRTRSEAGAELRRIVAADPSDHARAVQRVGEMYVELVRNGTAWTLYISDLIPVPHGTRDGWAGAVSAPSVEWQQTADGCSAWCGWTEVRP